jgi:hypothetical protein
MTAKVAAVLDEIEARQQELSELIPDNIPLMQLAEMVVRGKVKLSPPQMRMLIEMLPYVAPKLSAVALSSLTGEEFAKALDRAIEASNRAKLIEAQAIEVDESR